MKPKREIRWFVLGVSQDGKNGKRRENKIYLFLD
jgi:hypothetical protein